MTFSLRFLLLPLALLLGLPGRLQAQQLDPTFHIPAIYSQAGVDAVAQQPDGRYVVAGSFTQINGQAANGLTRLDATGNVDPVFRQNISTATLGYTSQICALASGKLLVVGSYRSGSVQRNYMFRLHADGTLDPSFTLTPVPSPYPNYYPDIIQLVEQADGRVLMLRADVNNGGLIRLNLDGTTDTSFTPATSASLYSYACLALQADGKILVAGGPAGLSQTYLTRLQADGTLDASYQTVAASASLADAYVTSMALDAAGRLLVGLLGGGPATSTRRTVKRLLSSGIPDPSFELDASLVNHNCKQVLVLPNGNIVVRLELYDAANTAPPLTFARQLSCLLPTGAINTTFQVGTGPDLPLGGLLATASGSLLTWGMWNFNGQRRTLALLGPTGAVEAGFDPVLRQPGQVSHIVRQADGKVLLAGAFHSLDGHLTDGLGRLLPDGQPDLTFSWRQPNSSWYTAALAVQPGGEVLVAGAYNDGVWSNPNYYHPSLSRLSPNGIPDASFVPALTLDSSPSGISLNDGGVRLLAVLPGGQVLVGGSFIDAAGRANLTRLTATGAVDATFTPRASQPIIYSALVQADGSILTVTPPFATITTLQRLLSTGQFDPSFSYTPLAPTRCCGAGPAQVYALPVSGGYLATELFSTGDVMQRLTATGAGTPNFRSPYTPGQTSAGAPSSGINAVAELPDGRLLIGGAMQETYPSNSTTVRWPLARLLANGQRDATFDFSFIGYSYTNQQSVQALCVQPDGKVLVGGIFLQAGGQAVTGLVRLTAPTPLVTTPSRRSAAPVEAWPVPAREALHVALALAAHPQHLTLLNALGQAVLTCPTPQSELTLPTAGLPAGLYLLRVEYADGVAVKAVTIE